MSKAQKIERTSKGLAAALFDEFDDLVSGKSTPQQAKAKVGLANTICGISRLEMDYARFVSSPRTKELPGLEALPMGDEK